MFYGIWRKRVANVIFNGQYEQSAALNLIDLVVSIFDNS
jgi:hypothetical protein